MKIIFMGTPEFAVPALNLLSKYHEVIAVYTQAPKPAGRGQLESLSPVHILANKLNIPVFTPKTLRKEEAKFEFASLGADCAVVVAYGLILPKAVLDAPLYGCINMHPSLLPKFRGAAPMQRTILAGEKETAMCIMQMDEGVDTGDILKIQKIQLNDEITYSELAHDMSLLGANMLVEVLADIKNIEPQKQSEVGVCYANKISKEEGELSWNYSSEELIRKIRALNPWPGTFFYHGEEKIKVIAARSENTTHNYAPGTVIDSKSLTIACSQGVFQPLILQRPGKRPLAVSEFLRGYKLNLIGKN